MKRASGVNVPTNRAFNALPRCIKNATISSAVAALLLTPGSLRAQEAPKHSGPKKAAQKAAIKIRLTSVYVDDQNKALKFYTEVLGFVKKRDIPVGKAKWLTVVSPDEPDGTELLLEPSDNPATQAFKKAIFSQGIPLTAFAVEDLQKEYERMKKLGVVFRAAPTNIGTAKVAVFDDTCGNLIQLYEVLQN